LKIHQHIIHIKEYDALVSAVLFQIHIFMPVSFPQTL
jgi:hypothetical protein